MAEPNSEPTGDSAEPVLAEYLRRVAGGEEVDREQFLAEHPEAADQLQAYFSDNDPRDGMAGGAVVQPASLSTDPAQATLPAAAGSPATDAQSRAATETTGYPAKPGAESLASRASTAADKPMRVEQIVAFLAASELFTTEAIDDLLSRAPGEGDSNEGARLLDELLNEGRLTPFQCEAIRRGRAGELILGNYVLLDRLGRGGMGQVFRAWHRTMDRVVALKTPRPETMDSDNAVRRFHREVKTAARLAHPSIVTAYDADEAAGVHFLVMEHVAGSDLSVYVNEHGTASVAEAVSWVLQAAQGLALGCQKVGVDTVFG
jgi:hypothetical protein